MAQPKPKPEHALIRSGFSLPASVVLLVRRCQERDHNFPRKFSPAIERAIIFYAESKYPGLYDQVIEEFRTQPARALAEVSAPLGVAQARSLSAQHRSAQSAPQSPAQTEHAPGSTGAKARSKGQ